MREIHRLCWQRSRSPAESRTPEARENWERDQFPVERFSDSGKKSLTCVYESMLHVCNEKYPYTMNAALNCVSRTHPLRTRDTNACSQGLRRDRTALQMTPGRVPFNLMGRVSPKFLMRDHSFCVGIKNLKKQEPLSGGTSKWMQPVTNYH